MSENNSQNGRIAEITEAVKQQENQEQVIEIEEKKVQLVVFLLGNKYYAFYGECIKEIVPVGEISYVPGMPEYILGVINVRGDIESVLDLRKAMSLPANPISKRSRITIGEITDIRSGLLVDSVEDVLEILEDQIHTPETVIDAEYTDYIAGESTYKDHELIILDLGKLFEALLNY